MLKSTLLVSSSNGPPRAKGVGSEYLSFVFVGVFDDDDGNGDDDNGEDNEDLEAPGLSWVGKDGTPGSGSMSVQSCPEAGP